MGSRTRHNQVQIITREGEVKIKLEIDININTQDVTVRAEAQGGPKLEEVDENVWTIPDFKKSKKIQFGKEAI